MYVSTYSGREVRNAQGGKVKKSGLADSARPCSLQLGQWGWGLGILICLGLLKRLRLRASAGKFDLRNLASRDDRISSMFLPREKFNITRSGDQSESATPNSVGSRDGGRGLLRAPSMGIKTRKNFGGRRQKGCFDIPLDFFPPPRFSPSSRPHYSPSHPTFFTNLHTQHVEWF